MSNNWPTKKLGEVTKIEGGGTPSTKNPLFWNGDVLWLTPKELSDFSGREIFDTERKITSEGLKHSKLFPAGAVLFTSRAPIGYVAIAGIQMATNQGFKNFICNEKVLNNGFLYYFLKLKTKYLQSLGRGATFTEISRSILEKVEIPLPPLEIQKQIVERLDKIVAAQKLNDDLIQKANELFQSLLHKELNPAGRGWEMKKLAGIAETSSGGTPLKDKAEFYENGTIPWLRSGEVSRGLIFESELFITEKGLKNSSAKIFPIDTVLVAMYGATAGQVGLLKFEASTNQAICGILPNNKFISEYLYYFLKTQTKKLIQISTGGAQPNISQQIIRNIKIPLPDLKTQKQIVAKLSAVQYYKTQLLAQKSKLKELFNSVLAKSFNGQA